MVNVDDVKSIDRLRLIETFFEPKSWRSFSTSPFSVGWGWLVRAHAIMTDQSQKIQLLYETLEEEVDAAELPIVRMVVGESLFAANEMLKAEVVALKEILSDVAPMRPSTSAGRVARLRSARKALHASLLERVRALVVSRGADAAAAASTPAQKAIVASFLASEAPPLPAPPSPLPRVSAAEIDEAADDIRAALAAENEWLLGLADGVRAQLEAWARGSGPDGEGEADDLLHIEQSLSSEPMGVPESRPQPTRGGGRGGGGGGGRGEKPRVEALPPLQKTAGVIPSRRRRGDATRGATGASSSRSRPSRPRGRHGRRLIAPSPSKPSSSPSSSSSSSSSLTLLTHPPFSKVPSPPSKVPSPPRRNRTLHPPSSNPPSSNPPSSNPPSSNPPSNR